MLQLAAGLPAAPLPWGRAPERGEALGTAIAGKVSQQPLLKLSQSV